MSFSNIVWNKEIYNKIINMPFNQELMNGTLNKEKFLYYIEQDSLYLKYYSKALSTIATKLDNSEYAIFFLKSSINAYVVEKEVVHKYFKDTFKAKNTNKITTANIAYTSYLISTANIEAVEVATSSILPCFWIYNELGKYFRENANIIDNPYKKWIETYSDEEFSKSTEYLIKIVDSLYKNTTKEIKEKMIESFNKAFIFEYRFWNDSYNLESFDNI